MNKIGVIRLGYQDIGYDHEDNEIRNVARTCSENIIAEGPTQYEQSRIIRNAIETGSLEITIQKKLYTHVDSILKGKLAEK